MNDKSPHKAPRGMVPVEVAAEILGVSDYTARKMAREGRLPAFRPFGPHSRWAFDPEELEAHIRASRIAPVASR